MCNRILKLMIYHKFLILALLSLIGAFILIALFSTTTNYPVYESLDEMPQSQWLWLIGILGLLIVSIMIGWIVNRKERHWFQSLILIVLYLFMIAGFSVWFVGILMSRIHIPYPTVETIENLNEYIGKRFELNRVTSLHQGTGYAIVIISTVLMSVINIIDANKNINRSENQIQEDI